MVFSYFEDLTEVYVRSLRTYLKIIRVYLRTFTKTKRSSKGPQRLSKRDGSTSIFTIHCTCAGERERELVIFFFFTLYIYFIKIIFTSLWHLQIIFYALIRTQINYIISLFFFITAYCSLEIAFS